MAKRKAEKELTNDRIYRWRKSDAPSFEAVKIIVGKDSNKKVFLIELSLLVQHSEFFAAALNGNWRESQEREVTLEDEDPEVFKMFGLFLRHGKIFSRGDVVIDLRDSQDSDDSLIGQPQFRSEGDQLSKAWCLGQALLSTSFKDAVLDAYYELNKESYCRPYPWEAWVYDKTASTSGMRKFVVDFGAWYDSDLDVIDVMVEETPRQYFIDLAVALKSRLTTGGRETYPFTLENPSCRYHEHVAEGKPCWWTLFPI